MTAPSREKEICCPQPDAGTLGSLTGLFSRLEGCDPSVLNAIWQRFFPRMAGLARKTLTGLPTCGVDADDVAQSAFISFWRALDGSAEFKFGDRNDLWKLLAVITARKARKRARRQLAQKRGGGRTLTESELVGHTAEGEIDGAPLSHAMADIAPPEFDLICEEMLLRLEADQRAVTILRLQGYSSEEIAARLDCSPRTVQRKLEAVAALWSAGSPDD